MGGCGLRRPSGKTHIEDLRGGKRSVTRHVPQRQPDHGPRQRVGERVKIVQGEAQGAWIVTQLRIGQVVVVDGDELGADPDRRLVDGGRPASYRYLTLPTKREG